MMSRQLHTPWEGKTVKGRVLVVDDDQALAEMLGIVLRKEGLDVAHVGDGARAIDAFHETRPDLVLLDVMLPGICLLYTSPSPRDS